MSWVTSEVRFVGYALGLYGAFMYWGYLQEQITSTTYQSSLTDEDMKWNYPLALNFCMALATFLTATAIELFVVDKKPVPTMAFWKPALTACLASPIGYAALQYISYPLMVLTKSSKPVPVMLIGIVFYKRTYRWYKYVSVALVCAGIFLFTFAKKLHLHIADTILPLDPASGNSTDTGSGADGLLPPTEDTVDEDGKGSVAVMLFGMMLVIVNLALDGYTNNEQDRVFEMHKASAMDMMKYTNFWQALYQALYLTVGFMLFGVDSELVKAKLMMNECPKLKMDIALFCIAASVGQVLIFGLMKEFGSLVWITVSVTRKLFTIILSVFMFKHHVNSAQWTGVGLVFAGLGLEIVQNYRSKLSHSKAEKEKQIAMKKSDSGEDIPLKTDHSLRSSDIKRRVRSAVKA